jgi:hypothetical protein
VYFLSPWLIHGSSVAAFTFYSFALVPAVTLSYTGLGINFVRHTGAVTRHNWLLSIVVLSAVLYMLSLNG